MGGCSSCLRLLLNEADVKIHVIEPTSIMGGANDLEPVTIQPSSSTLQVPPLNRPRTPIEPNKEKKEKEKEKEKEEENEEHKEDKQPMEPKEGESVVSTLQIPQTNEVRAIPVKPKDENQSDSLE
ncbi:hypothetical protein PMAYCL1PPCAC_30770 [Pristionchus mayeri]|uniref:Uncharacterized protein n=1 Tax=Pristionchus mayeri TaxID=1317129 RepID=A0AAN5DDA7_9BILA|nr:hypothetical protein PMAYCL1PPCAC_30770 [Pristionchus mayeri]